MGKLDTSLTTSKRYYLYRVTNPGPDCVILYRTSTGGWVGDFGKAMLWDNTNIPTSKGKLEFKNMQTWMKHTGNVLSYCVGSVTVVIDTSLPEIVTSNFK